MSSRHAFRGRGDCRRARYPGRRSARRIGTSADGARAADRPIGVVALPQDVAATPGHARFAPSAEPFARRTRTRIARRQFEASAPCTSADSAAAAAALSQTAAQVFDALVPWLERELQGALSKAPQ